MSIGYSSNNLQLGEYEGSSGTLSDCEVMWWNTRITFSCRRLWRSPLQGRNWLTVLRLNWAMIAHISVFQDIDLLLSKCPGVFSSMLGTLLHHAKLYIKNQATPKFFHPHLVPFALKEAIKKLNRLQAADIIESVSHSDCMGRTNSACSKNRWYP